MSDTRDPEGGFIPALRLSQGFYDNVVSGLIGNVRHSAAHLGEGSDVLGFDTERSTDHGWGLRLQIFADDEFVGPVRQAIDKGLPVEYRGWSVRYYRWQTDRVEHHIEVTTLSAWFKSSLGFDPRDGMTTALWLSTPQQLLLEATKGAVFRDDSGDLTQLRQIIEWYPRDVWLWIMACQWSLAGSLSSLVGRAAEVGDDVGSRLVAAKIARLFMQLFLLQDRIYVPYDKWLGTAVARLNDGEELTHLADEVLSASNYKAREAALLEMCLRAVQRHNVLRLTSPVSAEVGAHDVGIAGAVRPYRVMDAGPIVRGCLDAIEDPALKRLNLVGAIDQMCETSDPLIHFTDWPLRLSSLYEEKLVHKEEVP